MSADPGTLETFPHIEQRTDDWYALRAGLMTASAVNGLLTAKTLAVADNDISRGLVAIAAAERITGYCDPTYVTVDMQRGVEDEPFAAYAYADHHAPVTPCGFMVRTWANGTALGYSPDGLIGDDGLIEIKSRRGKKHVETVISGEVPAENMAQLQAGLLVSGREWCDYVSYCAGLHLWTKRVYPDDRWFEAIRAAVEAFERAVSTTVFAYTRAVAGLPLTERPVLDLVI